MKKLLPKLTKNPQGFTLIELLVVISIIAILSVIAMALLAGIQKNARDANRRLEIDAIAKAFEINKTIDTPTSGSKYVALDPTQFVDGVIPTTDPKGNPYCGNTTANTITADPAVSAWGITTTPFTCPTGYSPVSATIPIPTAGGSKWKVCALLETGGTTTAPGSVFCRINAQ